MRTQKIFSRLLVPTMMALLLLPPLSCLIFHRAAKRYAYNEAVQELAALQERIVPIMEQSFSGDDEDDPIKSFLGKAGPLASQMGGNARLLILAGKMQVIYPRDEQLRAAVTPLAEEFTKYIQNGGAPENDTATFHASDGETYLVNIYEAPIESQRLRYVITYCPASRIGGWVTEAAVLVLAIASVFVVLVFAVLWAATRSITQPLHRLCREAERIGGGSFAEIEPAFSLKELEDLRLAMNRMSEQLMRSDQSQKNFFQNVSHELRNPLMSISGYAQGIEQGVFQPPQEAAHTILAESLRLTEVVNSLLTLSRLESGRQDVSLGPVRVIEVIEDCLDRLNGLAVQRGISLVLVPFDKSITAYGEEELLGKVLENLLTNAIRYAKTTVTVSVQTKEKQAEISVLDDGTGIDEKDLPHLFERCYKGKGGNFGIGLAIAHSAAEKMGGELEATNRKEGGAIFTLRFNEKAHTWNEKTNLNNNIP